MPSSSQDQLQTALGSSYTIERELGRGGMATVYLARDNKHGRHVALKVLHDDLAATLGPERFRREIATAAQLAAPAHPRRLRLRRDRQRTALVHDALRRRTVASRPASP